MLHTIKAIIDNQEKFKEEIISALKIEARDTKKTLDTLSSDDPIISGYIEELKEKISKTKTSSLFNLFFLNKNKSKKYYAFWDEKTQEVLIYKYDERKKKRIVNDIA